MQPEYDWRSPMEKRRDEIEERFGKSPENFTPEILRAIANGPIYDVFQHYCPAGKLTLEQAKAREAQQIIREQK